MKSEFMDKIIKELKSIGKASKIIIKYGLIFAAAIFVSAAIVFVVNNYYLFDSIIKLNSISLMKTSVDIFAEVIIGALVIDYLGKNISR